MQKKPKPFIDLLESKHLLAPEIVEELRRQVAESKTRLTPELLAKLLVDNGHLTKFQASKLIAELNERADAAESQEEELGFASEEDDELGFAPDADMTEVEATGTPEEDEEIASVFGDAVESELVEAVGVESIEVVEVVGEVDEEPISEVVDAVEVVKPARVRPAAASPLATEEEDAFASPQRRTPRPVRPPQPTSSPWDSFRILGVGLILALFLVAGYFLLNWFIRGNAEDRLARANNSYESRSYETAANMYADFAEDFPTSEDVSFARVRAALATLRNDSEGAPDPEIGLDTALQILPTIADEAALAEQRSEVAGILIALAGKFNERADAAKTTEERKHLMTRMESLMELINNDPRFVGANEKNQQAPTLSRIEEDQKRIEREILRDEKLAATLNSIDERLAEKDTVAAYEARKELINEYPLLEANEAIQTRVKQASEIQQTLVKSGSLRPSLNQTDTASDLGQGYVLGNVSGRPAEKLRGQIAIIKVKGSVYGINAETGEILWRRFVGRELQADPLRVGETSDVDALVCEPGKGRITRVDGVSGDSLWSVNFGTPIHLPVAESGEVFVSCLDGHVIGLDLESGQSKWVTQLPQPTETAPGLAFGKPHLYIMAEHSNLYVISRSNGDCQEVYYTGHRAGSVVVPPKLLLGQLFVMENLNSSSAKIRILATSDSGLQIEDAQVPILMDGNILVEPRIDGRKMVVQSDLGQIVVLDIEPTLKTQKVSVLASVPKNLLEPKLSWSVFSNNKLWVADTRFTRLNLQVSLGKLGRVWTENDGDTFAGPPQKFGDDIIIHTRRLRGNQGNRVAAVRTEDGQPIWEVDLGVPVTYLNAAGDAQVDALNTSGMVFDLDERRLRSTADANPGGGRSSMNFQGPVNLSPTVALMLNTSRPNQFAVYANRSGGGQLTILSANFGRSRASCSPVAVGRSVAIGLDNGQFSLFDPSNGSAVAAPYQPPIQAGKKVRWNTPVYLESSQTLIVASDLLKLVRLSVGQSLRPLTEKELEVPLSGPLCQLGGDVAAVRSTSSEHALVLFDSLSLNEKGRVAISGPCLAGPYSVDGNCVLQTASKLTAISSDGQKLWEIDFPKSLLVGPPVAASGKLLCATRGGDVWLVDPESGELLGQTTTGQMLSSTPLVMADGFMVGSDEGTVLALPLPASTAEAP